MHNCVNGKLPESFKNFFEPLSAPNRTNGFKTGILKKDYLSKFPTYFLPKTWNDNSIGMKSTINLTSFKHNLKELILGSYPTATKCKNKTHCPDCK